MRLSRYEAFEKIAESPIFIVLGGAFGSEAKGAYIAWMADPNNPNNLQRTTGRSHLSVVRTGGPQAGHCVIYKEKVYAMRQVPCGWVNPDAMLYMGPGSLIDVEVMLQEIKMVEEATGQSLKYRLMIDRHATIVEEKHREAEHDLVKGIGSTGEGVGAAQADKVMRRAKVAKDVEELKQYIGDVGAELREQVRGGRTTVLIESTQGWGLSLNGSFYPTCTSRDINPGQVLSDSGLPSNFQHSVVLIMRTFPIRVAGPSGPMSEEVTWEQLAEQSGGYIKPEKTTVTKRIRRIAKWNPELARMAVEATNADAIVLTFFDYVRPDLANAAALDADALNTIYQFEQDAGAPILFVSTGFQRIVPLVSKSLV